MEFFDSHCHIDFATFELDRKHILDRCQKLGIKNIVVPATTSARWLALLDLCNHSDMLHPTLGLHPMFMNEHTADDIIQLERLISSSPIVAIGEIGLDFYLPDHDKTAQIELVSHQLDLAKRHDLPVILHVRKAHDEMIQLLKQYRITNGIVHAFSGSLQQAKNYINQGLHLGIGGGCTYPRASRLRSLIAELPLSSLVLETDAPDMPLLGKQGQRNSPENIYYIAQQVSELREEPLEHIASITSANCHRIFNLNNEAS
jgi:TatD DNase family protein